MILCSIFSIEGNLKDIEYQKGQLCHALSSMCHLTTWLWNMPLLLWNLSRYSMLVLSPPTFFVVDRNWATKFPYLHPYFIYILTQLANCFVVNQNESFEPNPKLWSSPIFKLKLKVCVPVWDWRYINIYIGIESNLILSLILNFRPVDEVNIICYINKPPVRLLALQKFSKLRHADTSQS